MANVFRTAFANVHRTPKAPSFCSYMLRTSAIPQYTLWTGADDAGDVILTLAQGMPLLRSPYGLSRPFGIPRFLERAILQLQARDEPHHRGRRFGGVSAANIPDLLRVNVIAYNWDLSAGARNSRAPE